MYVCLAGESIIWLGLSFAYKALLQIVAMFMAFHTRKVKIKALNDSKAIAAIIYINSIVLVLMIVNSFVFEAYHNVHAALFGLASIVQATMFLGFLFIPKVNILLPCSILVQSNCNRFLAFIKTQMVLRYSVVALKMVNWTGMRVASCKVLLTLTKGTGN